MKANERRARVARAGFTLLESVVGLTIFAVVGYGLAITANVGARTEQTVISVAAENRSMRKATTQLLQELRETTEARITVTRLDDGNDQVRFMQPIDDAGAMSWGVFDRTLGIDAATQNRVDWQIQYTVEEVVERDGRVVKQLVRHVLDDQGRVQRTQVIARPLRSGTDDSPGFTMTKVGDIWQLTLSTLQDDAGNAGMRAVFHVQTRN